MTPEETKAAADAAAAAEAARKEAEEKVTFTEAQQKRVDEVVQSRLARQEATLKASFQEDIQKLREELTKPVEKKTDKKDEADPEKEQYRQLLQDEKAKAKAEADARKTAEAEREALRQENAAILKKNQMRTAMKAAANFHDPEEVMALTDNPALGVSVELDKESGQYVVRERGVIKQNASLEPMTLEDFYREFASKRPHFVNGDTKSGTGASESRNVNTQKITSKADFKSIRERIDWIKKNGVDAFEELPLK